MATGKPLPKLLIVEISKREVDHAIVDHDGQEPIDTAAH